MIRILQLIVFKEIFTTDFNECENRGAMLTPGRLFRLLPFMKLYMQEKILICFGDSFLIFVEEMMFVEESS